MTPWTDTDARRLTAAEEVRIATRRADGTLRPPTTVWIVGDGDRVFIRSTNGRTAAWFRHAVAAGTGRITAGGHAADVVFSEADAADLPVVDAAYRTKYRDFPSITDHLAQPGPRTATLQVHPA